MEIYLGIVGSRNYDDYMTFEKYINEWISTHGVPLCIISGGATGIDTLAKKYAREHDISFREFVADWKKYGKNAGPKRNTLIVNASTHLIAFPGPESIGTYDTINKANKKKLGMDVIQVGK